MDFLPCTDRKGLRLIKSPLNSGNSSANTKMSNDKSLFLTYSIYITDLPYKSVLARETSVTVACNKISTVYLQILENQLFYTISALINI